MAPLDAPGLLLQGPERIQAQMGGLDLSLQELSTVIPQSGGRRRRKSQRGGMHDFQTAFQAGGRKSRKSRNSRKSRKSRKSQRGGTHDFQTAFQAGGRKKQRGGMANFDSAYTYNPNYAGQNNQWSGMIQGGAQAPGSSLESINYV